MRQLHNHVHGLNHVDNYLLPLLVGLVIALYSWAAIYTSQKKGFRSWPIKKIVFWALGVIVATVSIEGPLADAASNRFQAHMVTHLLLGMLAPLLLALSSPIALLLRTLPTLHGRKVTKTLQSGYLKFLNHPATAASINIGGLWLLYTTELYHTMHQSLILHTLVHFHVFAAGYLFTASIVYFEPVSRRFSYKYRTIVFILFVAAHSILSKYIYANPPAGVGRQEAEEGALIMYYGGDLIDALLIFIMFRQWYLSTKQNVFIAVQR